MEKLVIAGREFNSRLFLGTGKFNSNEIMEQSILASGTEMVTVAMKRIELENKEDDMLKHIRHPPHSALAPTLRACVMPRKRCLPHKWHVKHSEPTG